MKTKEIVILFLILFVICIDHSDCTLCKPYSWFRVDFKTICQCSVNGRQYSCQELTPHQQAKSFLDADDNDGGYVLYTRTGHTLNTQRGSDLDHEDHREEDSDERENQDDNSEYNVYDDANKSNGVDDHNVVKDYVVTG